MNKSLSSAQKINIIDESINLFNTNFNFPNSTTFINLDDIQENSMLFDNKNNGIGNINENFIRLDESISLDNSFKKAKVKPLISKRFYIRQ